MFLNVTKLYVFPPTNDPHALQMIFKGPKSFHNITITLSNAYFHMPPINTLKPRYKASYKYYKIPKIYIFPPTSNPHAVQMIFKGPKSFNNITIALSNTYFHMSPINTLK